MSIVIIIIITIVFPHTFGPLLAERRAKGRVRKFDASSLWLRGLRRKISEIHLVATSPTSLTIELI
jgi:hypothetical protein